MKNKLKFTGERLIPKINVGKAFYYEHLVRYFFANQFAKDKCVLDLGCGTGYGSSIIKQIGGAKEVDAIDISPESIEYAKEVYGAGVNFRVDDLHCIETVNNNSIDLVVCFEVLEHTDKQELMIRQIKRVLKRNGLLIISTPNIDTYPKGNEYHLKELSPRVFSTILSRHFHFSKILFQNFFLSEEIISKTQNNLINLGTSEDIFLNKIVHLSTKKNIKDSEYLLAVCSDSEIPKFANLSLSTDRVDNFDLTHGILSLSRQFSELYESGINLQNKLRLTELELLKKTTDLAVYQSSKIYQVWNFLKRIKKYFLSTKS